MSLETLVLRIAALEARLAELEGHDGLARLNTDLTTFRQAMARQFAELRERDTELVHKIAGQFTTVYGHLAGLKAEVAEVREEMISQFAGMDAQFDRVEGLLLRLIGRLFPEPDPVLTSPPPDGEGEVPVR